MTPKEKRRLVLDFVHGLKSWKSLNRIPDVDVSFNELGFLELKTGPDEVEITAHDLLVGLRQHLPDFEQLRRWASILVCGLVNLNLQSMAEESEDEILECLHDMAYGEATKERVKLLINKLERLS